MDESAALSCGDCDRFFGRPPSLQPMVQPTLWQPEALFPLGQGKRQTIVRDTSIRSPVLHLVGDGGPFNVVWGIGAVVVNSLKPVLSRWSRPHVTVERFKRCAPAVTDSYSTAPIVFEGGGIRVVTPRKHRSPSPVLARFFHPMGGVGATDNLVPQASTGRAAAALEMAAQDGALNSAITTNVDAAVLATAGRIIFDDGPAAKTLSGEFGRIRVHRALQKCGAMPPAVASSAGVSPTHFTMPGRYPDMCGRPDHDICERCQITRQEVAR